MLPYGKFEVLFVIFTHVVIGKVVIFLHKKISTHLNAPISDAALELLTFKLFAPLAKIACHFKDGCASAGKKIQK